MALTARQKRFVEEYAIDANAAAAARRAGYSERTAREIGRELLRKPAVSEAIAQAAGLRSQRVEITGDRVLREITDMALFDPGDIAGAKIEGPKDIAKLPEAVRRAIVGWSWDRNGNFVLKLSPKTPSLDLLARHFGLLKERVEHTGKDGGPIEMRALSEEERVRRVAAMVAEIQAQGAHP